MVYVYILKSLKDNSLYTGSTNDLRRRLKDHNSGKSKYTKRKKPFKLIYYEAYETEADARRREMALKKDGKALGQLKGRIALSLQ